MPRCTIDVFDSFKRKERKCLHKRVWGPICSFHARRYAIKIQSVWRSYSTKKKVNIFKNLPDDLWKHIIKYISIRNNTIKLLESHIKIYDVRILNMHTNYWRNFAHRGPAEFLKLHQNILTNREYFRKLLKTF